MTPLLLFAVAFFTVFLLAFQQQNVVHGKLAWAAATAFGIAVAQFQLVRGVAFGDWYLFIVTGAGGACGVTLSMFVHKALRKRSAATMKLFVLGELENGVLFESRDAAGKRVGAVDFATWEEWRGLNA